MRIAIVGAGMGGLALGRALASRGVDVAVFERRDRYMRTGLGLLLLPNGLAALDALGLGEEARDRSNAIDLAVLRSDDGESVAQFPLDGHRGIARRDLLTLLERGVPEDAVRWDSVVTGVTQNESGVTLSVGEETFEADLLVGADGARSTIRSIVAPDWSMERCPVAELVSVCDAPDLAALFDRTFVKHVRPGARLAVGLVPAAHGRIVWFVQFDISRAAPVPQTPGDKRDYLRDLIGDFAHPIPDLIERTDYLTTHLWATPSPGPAAPMAHGRVALIGDAAHPFPTLTSQGANMAMEDAMVLTRLLEERGGSPDTFSAFAEAQRERVAEIGEGGAKLVSKFLAAEDIGALPLIE